LFKILSFFTRKTGDLTSVINEKGCVQAGEEWLEKNLLVVAGVAVGVAFLQVFVLFILLASFFVAHFLLFFFVQTQCKIINGTSRKDVPTHSIKWVITGHFQYL
jgi:hypothetical protein